MRDYRRFGHGCFCDRHESFGLGSLFGGQNRRFGCGMQFGDDRRFRCDRSNDHFDRRAYRRFVTGLLSRRLDCCASRFAFRFRTFDRLGTFGVDVTVHAFFFTLTTAATTTATAATTLFAFTGHGFLIDGSAAFKVAGLVLRQQIGLVFVLAQCFGAFRLLLATLAAFRTITAIATFAAFLAFATLGARCAGALSTVSPRSARS